MKKSLFLLFILLISLNFILAVDGYKKTSKKILDIYNKNNPSFMRMDNFSEIGLKINYRTNISLKTLSRPTMELAGEEISPELNGPIEKYPYYNIQVYNIKRDKYQIIDISKDIIVRDIKLSPDEEFVAFSISKRNGIYLYIYNVSDKKKTLLKEIKVNDSFGDGGFKWIDEHDLLIYSIPRNRKMKPERSRIPDSPTIKSTKKKKSKMRTYTNLLKDEFDKKLFEYYFTSQPVIFDAKNKEYDFFNTKGIYSDISISPNKNYFLVEEIIKPYSYRVPHYYFAKKFKIVDRKGKLVKLLEKRDVQDEIPIGGTYSGPRMFHWQPLKSATIVWADAIDEGNPEKKVEYRDQICSLKAPFSGKRNKLFKTTNRFSGIDWSEKEDRLIFYEYNRDKMWLYGYYYNLKNKNKIEIVNRSYRNSYADKGELVTKNTDNNKDVFIEKNNKIYFINNSGDSHQRKYPYLMSYNYNSKNKNIIYKSREDSFETIAAVLSSNFDEILIRHERKKTPRNYYYLNLAKGIRKKITYNKNPYPELTNLKTKLIKYKRKDGVKLNGKLYLPSGYKKGERVPLIIWAYPLEYSSKDVAGQLKSTDNTFVRFWKSSIMYLTLEGYAVINASVPIVGDPQTVNDTFIDQTVDSIEAVITYLDQKEIINPEKVGIAGHSYGAFMVGNVLAHSNLCKAGIARSGAYNRSLTPFGFQHERRTLWEATDFYIEVSPYFHADKIKEPLLLIHGENDPNSGTYPLQSKRMFQAIKGNGGISKLVLLPYEGHGYSSRKSNLHVLAEMIDWCNKYLK